MQNYQFDVFLSYASEDRRIVDELTWALQARGVRVWRDHLVLAVGDSLRRSIDDGLSKSRYGIVLLSPHFFAKGWPQRELDSLVTRELAEGQKVVLPVWHDVDVHAVRTYSAALADKVALQTILGVSAVADRIASMLGLPCAVVHGANHGFYYKRMELAAEVSDGGTRWTSIKRSTVVATADGISGVGTSFRIDDLVPGSLEDKVEEGDVILEELAADHPRANERFFRFEQPLRTGQECTFTYVRRFRKARPQLSDMLVKKGASGCGEAVVRVQFDVAPLSLVYRTTDRSELMVFCEEPVRPEERTNCARRIWNPDIAMSYGLYWTYAI